MVPDTRLTAGRQDSNEQILLNAVEAEVRDRQSQSLHQAVLTRQGQVNQSVARPWGFQLQVQAGCPQPLPPGTSVAQILNRPDIGGRLGLLGQPGAGKTTTLLDLAATLVQQARADHHQPIPVLFHLSSWQADQPTLQGWLHQELRLKYGVSAKLGTLWLAGTTLIPLLDGWDELPHHRQVAAGQAINAWLQAGDRLSPLVVCGRRDACGLPALELNATLELEPLTQPQLEAVFKALALASLWKQVQHQPEWLELVRTPLWLSLSLLTQDILVATPWETLRTQTERQNYVLDVFISQQLNRALDGQNNAPKQSPTAQQTRHWLTWLARHIQGQSEDEFLIERMQPDLLLTRPQKALYRIVGGLMFGLCGGLMFGVFVGPFSGLLVALIVSLMFVLTRGDDTIKTTEDVSPTFFGFMQFIFVRQLNQLVFFVVLVGLYGFATGQIPGLIVGLLSGLLIGLLLRLSIMVASGLLGGLIFGLNHLLEADISVRTKPNQAMWDIVRYGLTLLAIFFPMLALLKGLAAYWGGQSLSSIPLAGFRTATVVIVVVLWATLFTSFLTCVQHCALRLVLFQAKAIPWDYARFLNACCDRNLLQRVGGRYRFTHRRVQERFATLP